MCMLEGLEGKTTTRANILSNWRELSNDRGDKYG